MPGGLEGQSTVYFRIYFGSDGSSNDDGVAVDDISITGTTGSYAWTTDASNGTSGWSSTNTEDITVTTSAAANHVGNYTLTVTDLNGCQSSDVVAVTSSF